MRLRRLFVNGITGRAGPPLVVIGVIVAALLVAGGERRSLRQRWREGYLYWPREWSETVALRLGERSTVQRLAERPVEHAERAGVGGSSSRVVPLVLRIYRAKPGDSLSEIAQRFDLTLDTISSLNRDWGDGVHLVSIGEEILIPNQNGIFVDVSGDFESLCRKWGVLPEQVLTANRLERGQVREGMHLFFPGAAHTGEQLAVVTGSAFVWPLRGVISSPYGYRSDPFTHQRRFHRGIDIAAPVGTPVRAAQAGVVTSVREDDVFGKQVKISHLLGFSTFYAHLSAIAVSRGERVTSHTVIGYVGTTGRSTGPHLHFELRRYGAAKDPQRVLTRRIR